MNVVLPTEKSLSVSMKAVSYANFTHTRELAMVIDSYPRPVKHFFGPLDSELCKPQRAHLWRVVLAMVKDGCHRTRLGSFLRDSDWAAPGRRAAPR